VKRRTLLQWTAALAGILPFQRLKVFAQPRELTPDAIAALHEIAPTVLPSSLGAARTRAVVDRFAAWARGYREGVPLAHGYGHPRLVRSGPTPVPGYLAQLAALKEEARAAGGRWSALAVEKRRIEVFHRAGERLAEALELDTLAEVALRELADAVRRLEGTLDEGGDETAVREPALRAAARATLVLQQTANLSVNLIVVQARATAVDLLRGSGLERDEAEQLVRDAARTLG
jgi:hypothetical protein